ncbi:MAG: hypothetical protein KF770_29340 [Anaerolineae bacterium]|nr:hypothetical protein [Anaerolineae bacterium]
MENKYNFQELTEIQLPEFLSRFQNFHDGLIREVQLFFMTGSFDTHARVVLSVIEHQQTGSSKWINLTLEVSNVSFFRLQEGGKQSCVVLFDIAIKFFGEAIYLDFCPFQPEPEEIEELLQSDFLIVGKRVRWITSPYAE